MLGLLSFTPSGQRAHVHRCGPAGKTRYDIGRLLPLACGLYLPCSDRHRVHKTPSPISHTLSPCHPRVSVAALIVPQIEQESRRRGMPLLSGSSMMPQQLQLG